MLHPNLPEHLHRRQPTQGGRRLLCPEPIQELIAVRPDLQRQGIALTRLFGEAGHLRPWTIALIPRHRHVLLHPGRVGLTEVVQGRPQGFLDTCQGVQTTDRSEHMRGIGALGSACFDPPMGFTGRQEGVQESLDRLMGQ